MSIQELETAIASLPADEFAKLMSWMEDLRAQKWDGQIADDLDSGRLDALLAEVDQEIDSGLAQPL